MKEMYNKVKDKTNANYYVMKIQKIAKKRKWANRAKIGLFLVFLLALLF